ncbi:Arginine transport ATP-binding protein ArtM [Gimesia maris]|nr:Arginine transport ATP-binding protein ArtM [Gimesia maris]
MIWSWDTIWRYREALWNGFWMTVYLNVIVLIVGTLIGTLIATARLSPMPSLRILARLYTDIFRSLPLLVFLVWLYFALPPLTGFRMRLDAFPAAMLGLSIHLSAFVAEIVRAGIEAVPKHNIEAAQLFGFSRHQIWRFITAPVAFRIMIPPLFGQYINQVKLSCLASVIAVPELLHTANTISTETFRPLELYTTLAVLFLIMLLPATWLQAYLEKHFSMKDRLNGDCHYSTAGIKDTNTDIELNIPRIGDWPVYNSQSQLILDNISVGYDGVPVVTEASLVVRPYQVTALVGANGSGKTTLLKAVLGLLNPLRGTISLQKETETTTIQRLIKTHQIGYVSQQHEPWNHMSVEQNILLPLRIVEKLTKDAAMPIATEWLKAIHLYDRRTDLPSELSGGQKQRLALARTLSLRPKVLALDEPTSAMDFRWVLRVQNILQQLRDKGILIILVSHGHSFLKNTADQIVFIDENKIREIGPASQILENPNTEAFRDFLKAV